MVKSPERLSSVLNKIAVIDNVEVYNISFDIGKKTGLFKRSRKLTYQKASDKARRYAELPKRRLGKVSSVSDVEIRDIARQSRAASGLSANVMQDAVGETDYDAIPPTREHGISSEINVVFSLDQMRLIFINN